LRTSLDQAISLQFHVSVRLHPRESPGAYSAILSRYDAYPEFLTIGNSAPLAQWLASCNMIIGSSSTVLYWACIVSMPMLSVLFRKNQYLAGLLPHLSSSHVYTSNTHLDQLVFDFIHSQAQNDAQKSCLDLS
jgi:spore coat polysaccharide biosynthesis predicted glycosyltransferase SpsG